MPKRRGPEDVCANYRDERGESLVVPDVIVHRRGPETGSAHNRVAGIVKDAEKAKRKRRRTTMTATTPSTMMPMEMEMEMVMVMMMHWRRMSRG
jgi:hypothetical protein